MKFLPVVGRELRVASRRRGTYWNRFFSALGALGIASWVWFFARAAAFGELSEILFFSISGFAFIYCLLVGLGVTADCISEEKRDGTLGLLFLTDLRGYDVILGKLVANSVNSFYRLAALIPIMAIPLLLGGLTFAEICRVALVLANVMFFSLAVGMFASSVCRVQRKAAGLTLGLILLVQGVPPLMGAIVAVKNDMRTFPVEFLLTSGGASYAMATDQLYRTYETHYWVSTAIVHSIGWAFLIAASVIVTRAWQDRPGGAAKIRWLERWERWAAGDAEVRKAYRERLLGISPYFWVTARDRLKPAWVLLALGLAAAVWLWLRLFRFPREMMDPGMFVFIACVVHTSMKMWLAAEACRHLGEDRRSGSLELILSTPLSVKELLRGQTLALGRQFAWPALIVLAADFAMFVAGRSRAVSAEGDSWLLLFLVGTTMFVADLYALTWVGMWLGVASKRANRAFGGTIVRILVVPWAAWLGLLTLISLMNVRGFSPTSSFFFLSWFTIGIVNNVLFVVWARTNLLESLRVAVTERFQTPARTVRPRRIDSDDQLA